MSIRQINEDTVSIFCPVCETTSGVDLDNLCLGELFEASDRVYKSPEIIRPPTCGCGAQQLFVRTSDAAPDDIKTTMFYAQRCAVNLLANLLIARDKICEGVRDDVISTTVVDTYGDEMLGVELPYKKEAALKDGAL